MRYLFFVQGEGRGHMTQAIALKQILSSAGHEVVGVVIGKNLQRTIPEFFYKKIEVPVWEMNSPNFVQKKNGKGINLLKSLLFNFYLVRNYSHSLRFIDKKIKELKPDFIINFYEPLIGVYYTRFNPDPTLICIGHQYFSEHPEFKYPPYKLLQFIAFRLFTKITSSRAKLKLALSLKPWNDESKKNVYIVPPLLRQEIHDLKSEDQNFILFYLVNYGLVEDVVAWHQKHPEVKVTIFCDHYDPKWQTNNNLVFQPIDDIKFLEALRTCSGFLSMAGFESLCEANYLAKPIFTVPIQKHFEQECNAIDIVRSGLGMAGTTFDSDVFLDYLKQPQPNLPNDFRQWVDSSPQRILAILEKLNK